MVQLMEPSGPVLGFLFVSAVEDYTISNGWITAVDDYDLQ